MLFLLPASLVELGVNRLAVPLLRPARGAPPAWHTALDYLGLFAFYFASLLAIIVAGLRLVRALEAPEVESRRRVAGASPLAALGALAAWAVLVAPNPAVTLGLEVCFAAVVAVAMARGVGHFLGRRRDLGAALGVVVLAVPLLLHGVAAIGGRYLWPEGGYDGAGATLAQAGTLALALSALLSPYCLAPRPFVRAVTRLAPLLAAVAVAVAAALLLRADYLGTARAVKLAIGVELQTTRADPQLTLYLLAVATLTWTLVSCALAPTGPRRQVALGLTMLVLGGYGFQWPLHFLLLGLGLTTIADAAVPVRAAERSLTAIGPAIDDATWGRYLGAVSAALRRRATSLHALTTRSEDGGTSSVLAGEADGRSFRVRIDRDAGVVLGLDVVIGRALELAPSGAARATLSVRRIDAPQLGDVPAAGAAVSSGDADFDERFSCRGSAAELVQLFGVEQRARAQVLLDGWLAYVGGQSLRYRSYPGRGPQRDPLLPLDELAQGRVPTGAAERMFVTLELLLELAARGDVVAADGGSGASLDGWTAAVPETPATSSGEDA
jgi:hypothetical protein